MQSAERRVKEDSDVDDIKIQKLINKAENNLEDYQRYVEKHGIIPCAWDVSSRLKETIQMIRDLRDEIYRFNSAIEAERAVKERFKELYVESVVDKALKEETVLRGNPRARIERDFHRAPFPPPNKE